MLQQVPSTGHGSGVHTPPDVQASPSVVQCAWVSRRHVPSVPQQAPDGAQVFGEHVPPWVQSCAPEEQLACVWMAQVLLATLQHAPCGWQVLGVQVPPSVHVPPEEHSPDAPMLHAPLELSQHEPSGWKQGLGEHVPP